MRKKWKKVVSEGLGKNICSNKYAAAAAKSLQPCPTLGDPIGQPTRLPRPWDSPGKNTGAGCRFLLHQTSIAKYKSVQGIFFFFASLMTSNKSLLS